MMPDTKDIPDVKAGSRQVVARLSTKEEDQERWDEHRNRFMTWCPVEELGLCDDDEVFGHVISGNCMKAVGIQNNDVVWFIKKQPKSGDIVAAWIDGMLMVKF